ncbi:hypothetical protein [Inquilinus limosus]|uniref:Uncharacterized protein n=1 Tax=Inquilinus limosus TaxID=171674 RepID=A0A211ZGV2_9PROT|nr:hypothetical protein [Inquilinus limosus]OWJ64473.1 hypothetical protein BWR60_24625 [Inquilinus limosus]
MAVRSDRPSSALLVRPILGLALGASTLPLLHAGVFPAMLPALQVQAGAFGLVTAESLLALLPFLGWAALARRGGERPPIIAGGVLVALALLGFLAVLRQPLAPEDSILLPGLLWIAAVVGAAGLVVGNHLHLIRLGGGSGGRITVITVAAATLFGPILVNAVAVVLQPASGSLAIPLGPHLFWAAMALALAFVTWRAPTAAVPVATSHAAPAAVAAAVLALVLLLAPIVWLNAIRLPLLVHAATVAGGSVPDLLGQVSLIGYLAIAVVLLAAALHPGLGLLAAGPLAAAVVLWALYGLDIQVPVSLAWGVSSDPAYAIAMLAGFAAILGRGAGPLRVGVAWTALQVAAVLGNRGGQVWWQYNQLAITDGMQWTGIGMAVVGAVMLAGVILARRAP